MCGYVSIDACRGQETEVDLLELELQLVIVRCMRWVLGTKFRHFEGAAGTLNYQAIAIAPPPFKKCGMHMEVHNWFSPSFMWVP